MSSDTELSASLARVVAAALGTPIVQISGLRRLSGGASRETWAFDAEAGGEALPLVLRRAPTAAGTGALMLLEAAAIREAGRVGVPVPAVLAASADPSELGAPYAVMRRIDGETIARRIIRDDYYAAARSRFAAECGTILGALHQMDVTALPGLADDDPLDALRALFVATEVASPTFELAFRWLAQHRPRPSRSAVVHGDFRLGNLIVDVDGVRAVLDWELVHHGDPMEDLGWLCVRAWRFGGGAPVGGIGEYDELFAAYQAASGQAVDPAVVRWWELYGTVRWGVIRAVQADRHLTGAVPSVELAAVGRRLCEQEYDCLGLLEELVSK
jgi:aminoglycoside phosphotransferase (APT) family kinase protein